MFMSSCTTHEIRRWQAICSVSWTHLAVYLLHLHSSSLVALFLWPDARNFHSFQERSEARGQNCFILAQRFCLCDTGGSFTKAFSFCGCQDNLSWEGAKLEVQLDSYCYWQEMYWWKWEDCQRSCELWKANWEVSKVKNPAFTKIMVTDSLVD